MHHYQSQTEDIRYAVIYATHTHTHTTSVDTSSSRQGVDEKRCEERPIPFIPFILHMPSLHTIERDRERKRETLRDRNIENKR